MKKRQATRRTFIKQVAYAGAVAPLTLPALARAASANDKLNIAFVGAQGQAGFSFGGCASQNIVAVADVDRNSLNKRLETLKKARQNANGYNDFRVMFEKEHKNIDAAVVATPDHQHAQAGLRALKLGKHLYCEKPLAHTVHEIALMKKEARRHKLATQMGTQIHAGGNYRRVVEKIQKGAIGDVHEVHVWIYGGTYSGGRIPEKKFKPPAHLNWDLWLGPAPKIEYKPKIYHPFTWRGWWDYGGGGTTDLACHYMDLPHWALDLTHPKTIHTRCSHDPMPLRAARNSMVEFHYPATQSRGKIKLTWHLGGTHVVRERKGKRVSPDFHVDVFKKYNIDNRRFRGNKILFIGKRGLLISDYGSHALLPENKFKDYKSPDQFIPNSIGHHNEWIKACKTGSPTTCNFEYSGALAETVLLGIVSHRIGNKKIHFDPKSLSVTNIKAANQYITKPYRKGWDIDRIIA